MFNNHKSYNRMYREGELTLGLHIPLENFKMRTPTLERQVELNKQMTMASPRSGFGTSY